MNIIIITVKTARRGQLKIIFCYIDCSIITRYEPIYSKCILAGVCQRDVLQLQQDACYDRVITVICERHECHIVIDFFHNLIV